MENNIMKILYVDMTKITTKIQDTPDKYRDMGGRWLTSSFISDEVDPTCHPLGPNNKIIFAPGIVTGTSAPSSGRISVGGKSPLTGGIKEANAGSSFAQKLAKLGYKAIVVEGQPIEKDHFWLLKISKDGFEHIEYVPPQVFTEYVRHLLKSPGGASIDGISYPSSRHAGGTSCVLFIKNEQCCDEIQIQLRGENSENTQKPAKYLLLAGVESRPLY